MRPNVDRWLLGRRGQATVFRNKARTGTADLPGCRTVVHLLSSGGL